MPWDTTPGSGFQLTHLLRGATINELVIWLKNEFQLTHLLRGATF